MVLKSIAVAGVGVLLSTLALSQEPPRMIETSVAPPEGFRRVKAAPGSFGAWLRALPVRPGRPAVRLFDGRKKGNQLAHHLVLDVDVSPRDLQQCADAVIRLRAEYLFGNACRDQIAFNFTSGDAARWKDWQQGVRPLVNGNQVGWEKSASPDASAANFRRYLETVFTYAGSASLEQELLPVADPAKLAIGDVFIQGGFPGHAVLVVDVAENATGDRAFLLAQSYMPAQDIHILRSPSLQNPWYRARSSGALLTPEWRFRFGDLKRFSRLSCEPGP